MRKFREVRNCRSAGEMIQGDDWDDEQYEDDKGDEYVDEFVNARAAVERYEFVCGLFLELRSAEVFLSMTVS
jgi:hypothetical protein